ncbi:O-antigen translocase [Flavobacterium sp. 3HN19-14]|uniref:O-antigen translocase n=1 Tax=Flavobacterium sp. 3HN19-14 TaxID=3448133 RepID=UPI003EE3EF8F
MNFIKSIVKTPLFRISSLNSLSVMIKLAIGLVTSKMIAVFVGPFAMALLGNLRNFMASLETISTLGFQNGVVKYTAESDADEMALKKVVSTLFFSLGAVAIVMSAVLFFFSDFWNATIFGVTTDYGYVFKALAIAMPWYAASLVLIAIINGLGKFREVIYTTIAGNIIGLLASVVLIVKYHTFGALLAIVISPSLLFLVSFVYVKREIPMLQYISPKWFSSDLMKKLSSFSLMAVVSAVISPLVFLAIRNNVIETEGIEQAGFWEAISRISTYYLMFITTVCGVYFLPKLVKAIDNSETKIVLRSYYKGIIPIFALALIVLFFLKDFAVRMLFTNDFLPVKNLFFWQLSGDVFKACSLILGYNLVARKHTIAFIVTECISMGIMFFGSKFLVPAYGIEGVVMAHFITYAVYFLILVIYFRKTLFGIR